MKLVEMLARELDHWAETTSCYTQDRTGIAWPWTGDSIPTYTTSWENTHGSNIDQNDAAIMLDLSSVADDHSTAIITRAEWEAEIARIKGERKVKPNKDGWIRHRGGKCPVDGGAEFEVRLRDGRVLSGDDCEDLDWAHTGSKAHWEIMAWRPHKPERSEIVESLQRECKAIVDNANSLSDPIAWRDRIREIDFASKEEEARHCAAMKAYDEERASLVAKLKAEGFVLIQSDEPNDEMESAQQDIAQQDMSDPANWRVGDLFEITGEDDHEFPIGELVKLIVFENDHDESDGHRYAYLDDSDYWSVRDHNVRFHSRPPQ